jgi:hypothetical protein
MRLEAQSNWRGRIQLVEVVSQRPLNLVHEVFDVDLAQCTTDGYSTWWAHSARRLGLVGG